MIHKKVSFRVYKIYFNDIRLHRKNTEYRADTDHWRSKLFHRHPPGIAVFSCGRSKFNRWITKIIVLSKEKFLEELGRKPSDHLQLDKSNAVIAVRLGEDAPEFYYGANEQKKGNGFP